MLADDVFLESGVDPGNEVGNAGVLSSQVTL